MAVEQQIRTNIKTREKEAYLEQQRQIHLSHFRETCKREKDRFAETRAKIAHIKSLPVEVKVEGGGLMMNPERTKLTKELIDSNIESFKAIGEQITMKLETYVLSLIDSMANSDYLINVTLPPFFKRLAIAEKQGNESARMAKLRFDKFRK